MVGQTLKDPPVQASPRTSRAASSGTLAERTGLQAEHWNGPSINTYEARLVGDLANLAGNQVFRRALLDLHHAGDDDPEANQMPAGGFPVRAWISPSMPDPDSLKKHLKVFCYTAAGTKDYLPFDGGE